MKKLITIVAILALNFSLLTFNCLAQPNGGFENWSTIFNIQEPNNWQTFNFLSMTTPPNPLSAFKATGIDKHSGNYALKLSTIFINNNPDSTLFIADTMSGVFTGKISVSPITVKYGFPYTGRPEKLDFWAKYTPVGNDVGVALVLLLKFNGAGRDTIAVGTKVIHATPGFTMFQDTLIYKQAGLPDSASILFSSSKSIARARVGSNLFVDDVVFTGWVGIDESRMSETDKVQLFPNPAKENITIVAKIEEADNIQIIDASGKLVGDYKIQNYGANINTSAFAEGFYIYKIHDKKNKILTKGKFNVVK